MKYVANPVIVTAYKIIKKGNATGMGIPLILENGEEKLATIPMVSRIDIQEGDYWVIQSDGYIYLNPKEVFERKYSPLDEDI